MKTPPETVDRALDTANAPASITDEIEKTPATPVWEMAPIDEGLSYFKMKNGEVIGAYRFLGSEIFKLFRVGSPGEVALVHHPRFQNMEGAPHNTERNLFGETVRGRYLLSEIPKAIREVEAFVSANIVEIETALATD